MFLKSVSVGPVPNRLGVTLLALLGLLVWDASGLDLQLARSVVTPHGFVLRNHWLLTTVLHDGARLLSWALILVLCLAVWWPPQALSDVPFARRLQLAVSPILAALGVSLAKAASRTSCPWDLAEFGGVAQYISHWSAQADGGAGHCFPAGHAAAGFAFVASYFALCRYGPDLARLWLGLAVTAGLVLGLSQQLRGAHFMSHTLWTAWLCWVMGWLLDAVWGFAEGLEEVQA